MPLIHPPYAAMMALAAVLLHGAGAVGAADPTFPDLVVPEQVNAGEALVVVVLAQGNVTVAVYAPTGPVFVGRANWTEPRTGQWAVDVTDDWGFGRGSVAASIEDGGNRTDLVRSFEVLCPSACLVRVINAGVSDAMRILWVVTAIIVLLGLTFILHAAHVYRVDRGELSWAEKAVLVLRVAMKRDPFQRVWKDQTGSLPVEVRENLAALRETARLLREQELELRHVARHTRFAEAEIVSRSARVKSLVGRIEGRPAPVRRRGLAALLLVVVYAPIGFMLLVVLVTLANGGPVDALRWTWQPWMAGVPLEASLGAGLLSVAPLIAWIVRSRRRNALDREGRWIEAQAKHGGP